MNGKGHEYDDIINLPHHKSDRHHPMPMSKRAAQFAPFAALSGYGEELEELTRLTERRRALSDAEERELNEKLNLLRAKIDAQPVISATYFVPDPRKEGGKYITKTGSVRRLDLNARRLIFTDAYEVPIDALSALEGEIFPKTEEEQP